MFCVFDMNTHEVGIDFNMLCDVALSLGQSTWLYCFSNKYVLRKACMRASTWGTRAIDESHERAKLSIDPSGRLFIAYE